MSIRVLRGFDGVFLSNNGEHDHNRTHHHKNKSNTTKTSTSINVSCRARGGLVLGLQFKSPEITAKPRAGA